MTMNKAEARKTIESLNAVGSPRLSEQLGPLPRPEWVAGAHTQAWRLETVLSWPTENARRYTAPLFTVDQMLAYAAQERAAERERCAKLCDTTVKALQASGYHQAAASVATVADDIRA